ncbi:MAG: glucose-1-phosphate adenylyltransferase [Acidobacteriota bacterium]|nr:MAG: glucose-1-phosphate adenylyltransferase [Acidobacteriota bacterium]
MLDAHHGPARRASPGRVLTFILAGGRGERLEPLTRDRSKPAVPFGGSYRIIDFTLSNCLNAGLRQIFLLTQYKSQSLVRHVTQGWDLFSGELGEYITTIPPQLRIGTDWYRGTADAVFQNLYTVEHEKPELILILSGDHVYRMNYGEMIRDHLSRKADATLAVVPIPAADASRFGVVAADEQHWVRGFREKPKDVSPSEPDVLANMGVYLFNTNVLAEALCSDARRDDSSHDFGHDVLPALVEGGARVLVHRYRDPSDSHQPYWRDIGTLDAYFEANMDLVAVTPQFNLYESVWPVRSAPSQAPPAKFVFAGGEQGRIGQALDSLVSTGVIVSGGHVERSILGPGCRINSWSRVTDSILMDGVEVGRHAVVERAIVDKGARIAPQTRVSAKDLAADGRFRVTDSGIVVVPRGAVVG